LPTRPSRARLGRSPLTRGRLTPGFVRAGGLRSIPAHAGETASARRCGPPWRVDPRSRGGDVPGWLGVCGHGGRSPLTRGRRVEGGRLAGPLGSIPAHAGETSCRPRRASASRVDPRSRGGDEGRTSDGFPFEGRSPLTRGRLAGRQQAMANTGSIPAHAGETSAGAATRGGQTVDPRSRGGDQSGRMSGGATTGRSPLTRGRPGHTTDNWGAHRSIPAHAGETCPADGVQARREVDPRSRGGDGTMRPAEGRLSGRSPLTRGRRLALGNPRSGRGSIPAHAGETCSRASRVLATRVDPRSRGGDPHAVPFNSIATGRSPLTRGRRVVAVHAHLHQRSIPAHAGETWALCGPRMQSWVDPRSRGGDCSSL